MAYTPVNWQTGDTITAERLNLMDRGWDVETTELFSETVTTADDGSGNNVAVLSYEEPINADTITVTFDGTDYVCGRIDYNGGRFYGGFSTSPVGPDFTSYPFFIMNRANESTLYTETVGEHTVSAAIPTLQASANFTMAVTGAAQPIVDDAIASVPTPLLVTIGTTTWSQVNVALKAGRPAFVWNHTTQRNQPDTYEFVATARYTSWTVYTLAVSSGAVVVNTYQAASQTGALEPVTS